MDTKTLEERLANIEEMLKSNMNKSVSTIPVEAPVPEEKKEPKEKKKRAPSEYNIFMKNELERLKREQGDRFDRKTAFKTVAELWSSKKGQSKKEPSGWF